MSPTPPQPDSRPESRPSGEAPPAAWSDRREIRTNASPTQAWRAFADPQIVQGWFADEAEGRAVPGDTIVHRFPAFGMEVRHEVVESVPGERLVLRVNFPGRPPMTQEIVVRTEAGETVIEMTNSGFGEEEWDGQWAGIDSGWKLALAQLRYYLENHFARRRTVYFMARPAGFEWAQAAACFREPRRLADWLTLPTSTNGSFAPDRVDQPVAFQLRELAQPLHGRVLALADHESLLSWDELEGALELKAFSAGPQHRMLALRLACWSGQPPARDVVNAWMAGALDRLVAAVSGTGS